MMILASASPRRQELLRLLGEEFRVIPADIDESVTAKRRRMSVRCIPEILFLAAIQACLSTTR